MDEENKNGLENEKSYDDVHHYCDELNKPYQGNEPEAPKPKKKNHVALWIILAAVVTALLIAAVILGGKAVKKLANRSNPYDVIKEQDESLADESENTDESKSENENKSNEIKSSDNSAVITLIDASDVVEQAMPAVVAVTDKRVYTVMQNYNPYSWFFGGGNGGSNSEESVSSGSGVIIASKNSELLIVTNNHVVDVEYDAGAYDVKSKGLTVEFCDGTTADAVIKGMDADADLAVIAVDLTTLKEETKDAIRVAVMGDSDSLKIGAGVVAIGNAGGYGQSVTAGIISAKDREVTIDNVTRKLLQTDAAINPGNSGGGLFNAKSELIGINCSKTVSTSIEGMGFAIPITYAQEIIEELMNKEVVPEGEQGYLGISGETVPTSYVEDRGYPEGVSVTGVNENSPADKAGIQIYDIITAVNGKKVKTIAELKKTVNSYRAGKEVEITYMRVDGREFKEHKTKVTLEKAPVTENTEEESTTEPENETPDSGSSFDPFGGLFDYFFR